MARILVVEDDRDLNAAYQAILKKAGHTVRAALNGREALDAVGQFQPQLILLDLLMPIMGGLEFLQHYNVDQHEGVQVLIFTNMENSPEVTEAYNLGAARAIIKSWTAPQNLTRVIDDVLTKQA
ncbi:MAG TPA: response regulator [Candidatus Saccharimonadales bacterium]|nr:response regulator [Candidatus Saccharimonadales bacterium]